MVVEGSVAAGGNVCCFCLWSLFFVLVVERSSIQRLCVAVEEEGVSVLLKDTVGAANYCCCEGRMVLSKVQEAGDVTACYAQLLRVVGCLVNQVRGLVDSNSAAESGNVTVKSGWSTKVSSDINISRDAIFTEVRELSERDKCVL